MTSQTAPYPVALDELVARLEYRKWWTFRLENLDRGQGSIGLTLIIRTHGADSYDSNNEDYRVNHYFPVPPAAYNERSWQRWLLDQVLLVERHECMEFFKIDGVRPYAPHHGPGNDPYTVFERGTDIEARTMYTGQVNEPPRPLPPRPGGTGDPPAIPPGSTGAAPDPAGRPGLVVIDERYVRSGRGQGQ